MASGFGGARPSGPGGRSGIIKGHTRVMAATKVKAHTSRVHSGHSSHGRVMAAMGATITARAMVAVATTPPRAVPCLKEPPTLTRRCPTGTAGMMPPRTLRSPSPYPRTDLSVLHSRIAAARPWLRAWKWVVSPARPARADCTSVSSFALSMATKKKGLGGEDAEKMGLGPTPPATPQLTCARPFAMPGVR